MGTEVEQLPWRVEPKEDGMFFIWEGAGPSQMFNLGSEEQVRAELGRVFGVEWIDRLGDD